MSKAICLKENELPCRRDKPLSGFCKDITGQRFGSLVALYPTNNKKSDGSIIWVCKCDCGCYTLRTVSDLSRTNSKHHCGNKIHNYLDMKTYKNKINCELDGCINNNLLVLEYSHTIDKRIYLKCKCLNCGSICIIRKDSFINGHATSCGCIRSKMEEKVKKYLNNKQIIFRNEYWFDDMVKPNGKPLRFDFYLPDFNICIECQGAQHYIPISYFGGKEKFELQKKYDNLKLDYCKSHDIKIYCITYKDNIEKKMEEILDDIRI